MKISFFRFPLHFAALSILASAGRARAGAVTLDGSFGHAAESIIPTNNIYMLTPTQGKQVGTNLFFSLGQFNLDKGETAQFSGPAPTANVITRVTGGPSTIDGKIQSTIPNANFYLINPAGVVFGPDATLDVSGSFIVTTANVVTLADRTKFAAPGPSDAILTTAAPAAYGFLSPSSIKVNGATIAVNPGENLSLISGSVAIQQGAILRASDGHLQVIAAGTTGTVQLNVTNGGNASLTALPSNGELLVDKTSFLVADGIGNGQIDLLGQQLDLQGKITAQTDGNGAGAKINIDAIQNCSIDGGNMTTKTFTTSPGGQISIQSGGILTISQGGSVSADTTLTSSAAGPAGNITINASTLQLQTSGEVLAQTSGGGTGGTIHIHSNNVQISGVGETDNVPTGLFADTTNDSTGAGGSIQLTANSLHVLSLGEISSTTNGLGAGGSINVSAKMIRLDGANLPGFTGIGANSQFTSAGAGAGGDITVDSSAIDITDGAGISAGTFGPGPGGQVYAQSQRLVVDGNNAPSNPTGLFAKSLSTTNGGNGGNIVVNIGQLDLKKAAQIAADSEGQGHAGDVTINASGTATLSSHSELVVKSLQSDGGDLSLGSGGEMNIINSDLSAQASGDGGNIRLQSDAAILIRGSEVTAMAGGNGGALILDPPLVVLDHSVINGLSKGKPVVVEILAPLLEQDSKILTDSGQIFPQTDVSGIVTPLPVTLITGADQLVPACGQMVSGDTSSFFPIGNGGMAIEPGGLLPSFVPDENTQQRQERDSKQR